MNLLLSSLTAQRRAVALAAIIMVQAMCAMFFAVDVIHDILENGPHLNRYIALEGLAATALVAGVAFLMLELRRILIRVETLSRSLRAASGEMVEVISRFFEEWGLTPSEKDVAMMILKGLDNDSIARLRGTASGTVRAQCSQIYSKANVDGRTQLLSIFVEELLASDDQQGD
jgi:DNA-binding CsgD family transcriptional regulator